MGNLHKSWLAYWVYAYYCLLKFQSHSNVEAIFKASNKKFGLPHKSYFNNNNNNHPEVIFQE